jgi:hypothetical protein
MDFEDTFVSGQLRICALCLGDIRKDDRCGYVNEEMACFDCFVDHEMKRFDEEALEEIRDETWGASD